MVVVFVEYSTENRMKCKYMNNKQINGEFVTNLVQNKSCFCLRYFWAKNAMWHSKCANWTISQPFFETVHFSPIARNRNHIAYFFLSMFQVRNLKRKTNKIYKNSGAIVCACNCFTLTNEKKKIVRLVVPFNLFSVHRH